MILYIGRHDFVYSVDYHKHDYTEFVYCTSGSGTFENASGDSLPYKAGDLVIVPAGMSHANKSSRGFSNYYVIGDRYIDDTGVMVKITDNERKDLLTVLEQAFFHFNHPSSVQQRILALLLELLLLYVREIRGSRRISKYSNMIVEDIIANFSNPNYNLDEVYSLIPYNREYAVKKFKKETGMTPKKYLTEHRLNLAARMLEKQDIYDLSIKEIAGACGFTDPLYMSRIFSRKMGISPSAWAERAKQSREDM